MMGWFSRCLIVTSLVAACGPAHGYRLGDFTWGQDDELLKAAMWEDTFCSSRNGRPGQECDNEKAIQLYRQFLNERELNRFERADILSHLGVLEMYGVEERDKDQARAYFKEALELAGDEFITSDMTLARTNYTGMIQDPAERLDAYFDLVAWIQSLRIEDVATALTWSRPRGEPMIRQIDLETGEESLVPHSELFPDYPVQTLHEKEARHIVHDLRRHLHDWLPLTITAFALEQPDPVATMERVIERTEGTPVAEKARASLDKARERAELNARVKAFAESLEAQKNAEE